MIYIDNGKSVIEYHTHPKTEKAVQTLLDEIEDLFSAESVDGMKVAIIERNGEQE
jgi:hypothetical protein